MSLLQHGAVQSHFLIFFLHLFNWFSTNLKIRKITKKNLNLICLHHSSPFNVFCAFLFLLLSSYIPRSCPGFGSMVVAMSLKRAYIDSRHLSYSQYFNFLLLCYPTILLPIVTAPAIYSIHPLLPPSCILLGKQNFLLFLSLSILLSIMILSCSFSPVQVAIPPLLKTLNDELILLTIFIFFKLLFFSDSAINFSSQALYQCSFAYCI